jgi:broad specificity phosphatase PhoE
METIIYLVRHAQYENPNGVMPSRLPGFPLSADGHGQAANLAKYFPDKNIKAIFASPLTRTKQTAKIIAKKLELPITTDDRLLEIRSALGGKPDGFDESLGDWLYLSKWYRDHDGETPEEIFARMDSFMREKIKKHKGEQIIVVSHGDPIMFLVGRYMGIPFTSGDMERLAYIQMGEMDKLTFHDNGSFISSERIIIP